MISGIYYEFIALPCSKGKRIRYSMPLGLLWKERPMFKVYRGTGLYRILKEINDIRILLYSPVNPVDYYLSIVHDETLEGEGSCDPPREYTVSITCTPRLVEERENLDIYECLDVSVKLGTPIPYSRTFGCLVEMLVVLTKIEARVLSRDYYNYLEKLRWCVERASPENRSLKEVLEHVLQRAREALGLHS